MKNERPIKDFIRDEILKNCPDLAAPLFDLEQLAEPFFLGLDDYDDDDIYEP